MALTTFVSGQVLTAAQLNDSFAAVGGLRLVKTQTIGTTVSSVTVSDAFSATYDHYKIIISGGASSATTSWRFQLGATTTGYYYAGRYQDYSGAGTGASQGANTTSWLLGAVSATGSFCNIELNSPFLSDQTSFGTVFGDILTSGSGSYAAGFLDNTTSYTAFTLFPSTGTITGGTIRVYGYANS